MWNYYKTVVINSAKSEDDHDMFFLDKSNGSVLNIWRNGQYDLNKITKINKTVGYAGTPSTLGLTVGSLTKDALYQLTFKVALEGKILSDYATPEYSGFYKPIVVNFKAVGTAATDADKIKEALEYALPEEVKVSVSGAVVTVTAKDAFIRFEEKDVVFEKFVEKDGLDCVGEYEVATGLTVAATNGKQPFATGTWILENLRLPNTLNYRYFGSNDEMPNPNTVYTQYTFDYVQDRPGLGGHSGVGQGIQAVTTHTFYIAEGAAKTAFEAIVKSKCTLTEHSADEPVTTSEE